MDIILIASIGVVSVLTAVVGAQIVLKILDQQIRRGMIMRNHRVITVSRGENAKPIRSHAEAA